MRTAVAFVVMLLLAMGTAWLIVGRAPDDNTPSARIVLATHPLTHFLGSTLAQGTDLQVEAFAGEPTDALGVLSLRSIWPEDLTFARVRQGDVRVVEIAREAADLRERIHARAEAMVGGGLIDEVRTLQAAGFEANPAVASAVGYRETLAWLRHGGTRAELVDAIARATNRLARKQRTWFRGQLTAHRVLNLDVQGALDGASLAQEFESAALKHP